MPPLQGSSVFHSILQGVALGWYIAPFQGLHQPWHMLPLSHRTRRSGATIMRWVGRRRGDFRPRPRAPVLPLLPVAGDGYRQVATGSPTIANGVPVWRGHSCLRGSARAGSYACPTLPYYSPGIPSRGAVAAPIILPLPTTPSRPLPPPFLHSSIIRLGRMINQPPRREHLSRPPHTAGTPHLPTSRLPHHRDW